MSLGSANEMEAHYKIARELEYVSTVESAELIDEI
jgi:hypothetical protein